MIFIENAIITFYKNIWNEHEYKYSVPTVTLFLVSTLFKKKNPFFDWFLLLCIISDVLMSLAHKIPLNH